jgi:hypothetical protein
MSNWSPADVPDMNTEIARFNAGGSYEISHFGGSTMIGGIDWTDIGATLTIGATPSSSSFMAIGSDFTINGTLNMTSNVTGVGVTLTNSGTVTNAVGASVNFNGTSNVVRNFNVGEFLSDGIVNVDGNTRFGTTNTVVTNNNAINIASGATLDFGNNATFNQDDGTLDNQGTFAFSNDTLNFNGGNFTGNAIELFSSTLNNNSTGTGVFNLTGSFNFYSGDLVAGQELNLLATPSFTHGTTATADFTNFSTLNMTSNAAGIGVTLTRNGTITNEVGGTINLDGTSAALRQVNVNTFDNDGIVNVDGNTRFGTTNTVVTNNNAINIASGKTLDFGNNATFNQDGGTLDNQGTFAFSNDTLNYNGGNFTGNAVELFSSTLNNNSTGTGVFNLTGSFNFYSGDLVAGQELNLLATPSFTHGTTATADFTNFSTLNMTSNTAGIGVTLTRNGTITNAAGGTISLDGTSTALRQLNVSIFDNLGTVSVEGNTRFAATNTVVTNSNAINIASGTSLDFGNSATFNQNGGTLDNQGTFAFSSDILNFNGGNFTGNAVELFNSTLNNNATGTGVFNMTGSFNFYSGDLVAGQELNLLATPSFTHSTTATADFTNFSTLNMTSNAAGIGVTLTRNGTITNAAAGTINLDGTSTSASRSIVATIDNHGQINNFASGTASQIGNSASDHLNSGIITNFDAGGTLTFNGDSFTNQSGGRLAGVGEFDFSATGLNNAGIIDPGLSPGMLVLDGNVTFSSSAALMIELGGVSQGSDYDYLLALDSLAVNGVLDVSFVGGFENSILSSDLFTIVGAGNLSGLFSGLNDGDTFLTSDGKGYFDISYVSGVNGTVVLSNYQAVPEPSMAGILLAGGAILAARRRFRIGHAAS